MQFSSRANVGGRRREEMKEGGYFMGGSEEKTCWIER